MEIKGMEKLYLEKVKVQGNLIGKYGIFEIEQTFINDLEETVDGEYDLQLSDNSTVIGFEIDVGKEHLKGICKESLKATEEYYKNRTKGNNFYRAYSIEENNLELFIGKINAKETVKIKVKYIEKLNIIDNKMEIIFPYFCFINKKENNYKTEFNINITSNLNCKNVRSKTHNLEVIENNNCTKIEIKNYDISKECEIEIELKKEIFLSALISKTIDNNKVLYISFIPEILEKYQKEEEYIFLIDISKFMGEGRLNQIKSAVIECLKKLKEGDKFNILTYDSAFRAMELESIEYNDENLEKAIKYVEQLKTLGSKRRIYNPLKFALYEKDISRNILIFSYAEVVEDESVIDFIKDNINNSRIFFFGINYKFYTNFLRKIEKVGRGKSELINSDEKIKERLIKTFDKIQNPILENLQIDYGQNKLLDEVREKTKLFNNEFYDVFAKIEELKDDIKISGKILDKEYIWKIDKEEVKKSNTDIEVLLEKENIERLQDCIREKHNLLGDEEYRDKIKEISEKYNIPVTNSEFIIVYEKDNKLVEAPKYESDLIDYKEENSESKEGKLKKVLKFLFRNKDDEEKEEAEEDYYEFQKGFIDDDIVEFDDERPALVDRFFRKKKVEEEKENDEEVYKYVDIENVVNEYYVWFINQKENKSILTYILLAIFYLNLIRDENEFEFDNFIEFLKENKEEILKNDLYQKLLCVCYRSIINSRNNEAEVIFNLLNRSYKKALVTDLEMPVVLEKISNKEYKEILKKNLVKENIDKILIKRCWENINFDIRGTLIEFFIENNVK